MPWTSPFRHLHNVLMERLNLNVPPEIWQKIGKIAKRAMERLDGRSR